MKTKIVSWVVLVVVLLGGGALRANELFNSGCASTSGWSGTGLARVLTTRGFFELTGTNSEPNINVATTQSFSAASCRLSMEGVKHSAGWNFSTAYLQIGLGNNLAVRLTSYGTNSQLLYNGTAVTLGRSPLAVQGNITLDIEYYASNNRVVVRQRSGQFRDTDGVTYNAYYTVLADQTFSTALATNNSLKIFGAMQYNGGYLLGNATVCGVLYTNCGSTVENLKLETIPDIAVAASPSVGSWGVDRRRGMNLYGSFTQADINQLRLWGCNLIRYQIVNSNGTNYISDGNGGITLTTSCWNAMNSLLSQVATANNTATLSAFPPLKVVLDVHTTSPFFPGLPTDAGEIDVWCSVANRYKLASLWKTLATTYKDNADIAAYEIINEPAPPRTAEGYRALNEIVQQVTDTIRAVDGNRTLIASGPEYSRPSRMDKIVPTTDTNTIYTFHMYEPIEFTNQGTGLDRSSSDPLYSTVNHPTYPSVMSLGWSSPYTDTTVDRAYVINTMANVVAFQQAYGKRVWVGEFATDRRSGYDSVAGTYNKNGDGVWSAYAWTKDVVEYMEERGWDWTYHCFRGDRYGDYYWSAEHACDAAGTTLTTSARIVSDRLLLMQGYFNELFVDPCVDTSKWSGAQLSRISATGGCFTLTGTSSQPAISVTTTNQYDTTALSYCRISYNSAKFTVNSSTAYMQVGLDQSGVDNLAVRLTYWGDNAKFYYNGTAYAFSLDARPVGYYGNVSLLVEYFNTTSTGASGGRVKITQLSGCYKKPSNGTVNNNSYNNGAGTVVVDQDFPGVLLAQGAHQLKLVGSVGNYGTGSTIDNIVLSGY